MASVLPGDHGLQDQMVWPVPLLSCSCPTKRLALASARDMSHWPQQASDAVKDFSESLATFEKAVMSYPVVLEIGLCGNVKVLPLFAR